ncbi:hypothetical protein ABVK25_003030 [Lepraria finkii]|uniref:Uncharacterized protein n=1 Tax=Lepraria finkii TaxID=1340010 RepID=A0ABR4BFN9_9LECA
MRTMKIAQIATTRAPPSYGAQNTTAPAHQPGFPPQQQQQQPPAYPSNAQNTYLPPGAAPPNGLDPKTRRSRDVCLITRRCHDRNLLDGSLVV